MVAIAKKKRGRPTQFRPEYAQLVYKYALLGCDDAEMANLFDVSEQTFNTWKKKHPDFLESIKAGKDKSDAEVADSLRNRAVGYEWDEMQPIKVKEVTYENGKRVKEIERVEQVMVHRVVPPDATSAIFWLKNRKKAKWRDTQDHTNDGKEFPTPMFGGQAVQAVNSVGDSVDD